MLCLFACVFACHRNNQLPSLPSIAGSDNDKGPNFYYDHDILSEGGGTVSNYGTNNSSTAKYNLEQLQVPSATPYNIPYDNSATKVATGIPTNSISSHSIYYPNYGKETNLGNSEVRQKIGILSQTTSPAYIQTSSQNPQLVHGYRSPNTSAQTYNNNLPIISEADTNDHRLFEADVSDIHDNSRFESINPPTTVEAERKRQETIRFLAGTVTSEQIQRKLSTQLPVESYLHSSSVRPVNQMSGTSNVYYYTHSDQRQKHAAAPDVGLGQGYAGEEMHHAHSVHCLNLPEGDHHLKSHSGHTQILRDDKYLPIHGNLKVHDRNDIKLKRVRKVSALNVGFADDTVQSGYPVSDMQRGRTYRYEVLVCQTKVIYTHDA